MNNPLFDTADFVILTALEEERDAMLAHLPQAQRMPLSSEDTRVCFGTQLPVVYNGGEAAYNIVVQCLLDMGTVDAALATVDAIRRWRPGYVLLVGIAGGVAENGAALGDVLVSTQIVDYGQQKLTDEDRKFRFKGFPVSAELASFAQSLRPEEWLPLIKERRPTKGEKGEPALRRGPIASASTLAEQKSLLQDLLASWPKLIGLEMEAAGAATAVSQMPQPPQFFMVRGVSDLCDAKRGSKNVQKWRAYARDVAAAYTAALLKHGPVEPRTVPPRRRRLSRRLPPLPAEGEDGDGQARSSSVWDAFHSQHARFVHEAYIKRCERTEARLSAPTEEDLDLMRLYLEGLRTHQPHLIWSPDGLSGSSWGDGIRDNSPQRLFIAKRVAHPLELLREPEPRSERRGTPQVLEAARRLEESLAPIRAERQKSEASRPVEELVSQEQKILLLGEPGAGKSTALRHLAFEARNAMHRAYSAPHQDDPDAEVALEVEPLRIPILVELKLYAGEAEIEILMARSINDTLREEGLALGSDDAESVRRLKSWLRHPGALFLLLFDGLNEVGERHHVAVRGALRSVLRYPHAVVVSCREHDYDRSLRELAVAHCLHPLPDGAIKTFLGWFLAGKDPHERWAVGESLFYEICEDERLHSLARNPLLLRLLAEVAWEDPSSKLPLNRARLFERFVSVMPQRRREEGLDLGVGESRVRRALEHLGFGLMERGKITADLDEILDWIPDAGDGFELALRQAQEWRLLESDGGRGINVEFIHPLFIEYFAASHIARRLRLGEGLEQAVGPHAEDSRWRETMLLLAGLCEKSGDLILWLCRRAQQARSLYGALLANDVLNLAALDGRLEAGEEERQAVLDALLSALGEAVLRPWDDPVEGHAPGWENYGHCIFKLEQEIAMRRERALPRVMAMFASGDERLQQSADRVLGAIGHAAVEPLLAVLDSPAHDPNAHRRAIKVLGEIGDWREAARVAAQAKPSEEEAGTYSVSTRGGTEAQLRQQDRDAEERLLADLEGHDSPPDLWQRRMEGLRRALRDQDDLVRATAVEVLGKTPTRRFFQADHPFAQVLEAASDASPVVRDQALEALGWWAWDSQWCEWFELAQVLAALERGLEDEEAEVRHGAIHALKLVPGDVATRLLLGVLQHRSAEMRLSGINTLKERNEVAALPELERLAREDTGEVKREWFRGHIHVQKVAEEAAEAAQSIQRHHKI